MESRLQFLKIDPDLLPIFEELQKREPIFHRAEFGKSVECFARLMAPGYWEVGASGRRYGRDLILKKLKQYPPVDAEIVGWMCSDFGLRQLGPHTYLLTYTLDQKGRITRRATIWRRTDVGWQILYHQGTLVPNDKDT